MTAERRIFTSPCSRQNAKLVLSLYLRRKKPAWATTRPSPGEFDLDSLPESDTAHPAESAHTQAPPNLLIHSSQAGQADTAKGSATVTMLHALNAASTHPAAPAACDDAPLIHVAESSQLAIAGNTMDSVPTISSAEDVAASCISSVDPDNGEESETGRQSKPVGSHAGRVQQKQGHGHASHHLTANRVTLARIGIVAQEQMEHNVRKERQNSIERHVAQHDMFRGGNQPAHTVHRPDAVPESFQEPTLAAILRETALAEDLARREAEKAAKAADNAMPLFVTTSSSPESTSRQHSRSFGPWPNSRPNSRPDSRPVSAANTLTRRQLASELSSGPEALLRSQLSQLSKLQSPRGRAAVAKESFSPSSTARLGSASSSLQVYLIHWFSAAMSVSTLCARSCSRSLLCKLTCTACLPACHCSSPHKHVTPFMHSAGNPIQVCVSVPADVRL